MDFLYFSWVREQIGTASERLDVPANVMDVKTLLDWLATRSAGHARALADRAAIRVAVDQDFAGPDAAITGAHEIAIFPPVTGG